MSHLLREHAPITEAGWALIDDEARERLTPALAARSLIDFSGPHGWQHSATNLGRIDRRREAARRRTWTLRSAASCRWWSCARRSRSSRSELARRRPRRRGRRLRRARRRRPQASPSPRTRRCSTAGRAAGITGISRGLAARRRSRWATDCERYPRHVAKAVEALLEHRASTAPTAWRSARRPTRCVLETTEHGGYPLLEHLRKILDGPLVWAPGVSGARRRQPARRRLPVRVGPGPLGRLRPPRRRRRRTSTWKRASASGSSRPKPPSR